MPSPPSEPLRRVCVFCGSSPGARPAYRAAADAMGRLLARRGIGIVYGGGSAGLMGALATAALEEGGHVIGVLPMGLFPDGVTVSPRLDHHAGTLVVEEVDDMHARKARFHALADAYVVLPGWLGTLEETAEVATWGQIGLHDRAIGFLDVEGFFDPLFAWFDHAVHERFLGPVTRSQLHRADDPETLLDQLERHAPATEAKWLDR